MKYVKSISIGIILWVLATDSFAFCGYFVAKGDSSLFNQASKVVIARDGKRTIITMSADYQGEIKDFAMVVPVPEILKKDQINIGENKMIDRIDSFTAPRLVEYFDTDPCQMRILDQEMMAPTSMKGAIGGKGGGKKSLGVTIEEQYTVGEYDIMILSAKQSEGLFTWLKENGYKLSKNAKPVLSSYIKQGLKFFIAKVNLAEQGRLGYRFLRPIQMAYESEKFMLPIRLGTLNAKGYQDLFLFALSKMGRVESVNYRVTKLPSDINLPVFVKNEFGDFYQKLFSQTVKKEDYKTMVLEYAWDMGWCDPCASDPLSKGELEKLGVFWLDSADRPTNNNRPQIINPGGGGVNAYVTRYHIRYDSTSFPEDIVLKETPNRKNFQGRYILRHRWTGNAQCEAAKNYQHDYDKQREKWASNMANLTGMEIGAIRDKMKLKSPGKKKGWWKKVFDSKDEKKEGNEKQSWWKKVFQ